MNITSSEAGHLITEAPCPRDKSPSGALTEDVTRCSLYQIEFSRHYDFNKKNVSRIWRVLTVLLVLSRTQRPDAGVHFSPRRRHWPLEATDGSHQSVPSQIHLPHLSAGSVWSHGHAQHHSRIRCAQPEPQSIST